MADPSLQAKYNFFKLPMLLISKELQIYLFFGVDGQVRQKNDTWLVLVCLFFT